MDSKSVAEPKLNEVLDYIKRTFFCGFSWMPEKLSLFGVKCYPYHFDVYA